jgi:hypothetical protein
MVTNLGIALTAIQSCTNTGDIPKELVGDILDRHNCRFSLSRASLLLCTPRTGSGCMQSGHIITYNGLGDISLMVGATYFCVKPTKKAKIDEERSKYGWILYPE